MIIRVLFFAVARERVGLETSTIELSPSVAISSLRRFLLDRYPSLATVVAALRIAVNQEFVGDDFVLHDGDEVALIPPVSGGA